LYGWESNKEGANFSLRKKTVRWTVFADVATSVCEASGTIVPQYHYPLQNEKHQSLWLVLFVFIVNDCF